MSDVTPGEQPWWQDDVDRHDELEAEVKRLRAEATALTGPNVQQLQQLQVEVERLRERLGAENRHLRAAHADAVRRDAEVKRLRRALDTIAQWRGTLTAADTGTMRMTARAALDA